jgi:hypothetical protein
MTQRQPRGPQLVVRSLRFHSPHASGVPTAGFRVPKPIGVRPGFVPFLFPHRRSPSSPGRWLTRATRIASSTIMDLPGAPLLAVMGTVDGRQDSTGLAAARAVDPVAGTATGLSQSWPSSRRTRRMAGHASAPNRWGSSSSPPTWNGRLGLSGVSPGSTMGWPALGFDGDNAWQGCLPGYGSPRARLHLMDFARSLLGDCPRASCRRLS